MKKIILLLSVVGIFGLTGCSSDDDNGSYVDNDTYSEVFEVNNVNFVANGNYNVTIPLEPKIYESDVILVYRLSGVDQFGSDVWEMVPSTYSLPEGTLSYFTDFSINNVVIYLDATFDPMLRQDYSLNQTFRIVIVPGWFSDNVNVNDYNAVMSAINDEQGAPAELKVLKK